jgi:thiamine-phosphate pyrophosphorylase
MPNPTNRDPRTATRDPRPAFRGLAMMVTDRRAYGSDDTTSRARLVDAAYRAAQAGVDMIQIRERDLEASDLMALAVEVKRAVAGTACQVVVNDRADVALAARADGVHLPAAAVSTDRVRQMVPKGFLVGRSVHDEREVAGQDACDYLVFGTVFESASKPATHAIAGLEGLAAVTARAASPVLAIGGVTVARLPDIARAGAAGIAAIGLFATATAAEMRTIVEQIHLSFGGR